MNEKNEATIIEPDDVAVTLNLDFTKSDIVNVVYAKRVKAILSRKKATEKALSDAHAAKEKAGHDLDGVLRSRKPMKALVGAAKLFNKAFGLESVNAAHPTVAVSVQKVVERDAKVLKLDDGSSVKVGDLIVIETHTLLGYNKKLYRRLTAEEAKATEELRLADNRVIELENELLTIRQAQAELPDLLVQLNAQMSERAMEKVPQGQALLDALEKCVAKLLPPAEE